MLVRIYGGSSGIKEYLEEGHKQGREHTRDELDERIILDGDLNLTDSVINNMNNDGERYLHITLAFKEDEISRETLEAITNDFKSFAFSAFTDEEYNFYAEAHLPKIKSYINRKTGDFVERKPHIHIVVPETNLLSGGLLNPFGKVDNHIKYLEAIQETLNNKYGLASPKDSKRTLYTDDSEILSRYKGDFFKGGNKELKNELLAEILKRKIDNYADFKKMLQERGEIKIRNKGTANEYLWVNGVNLRDPAFRQEFIELSHDQKKQRLATDSKYVTASIPQENQAKYALALQEWHERRAMEIRFLNSGNRKEYAAYKAASPEQKSEILVQKKKRFYEKHQPGEQIYGYSRQDYINDRIAGIADRLGTTGRLIGAAKTREESEKYEKAREQRTVKPRTSGASQNTSLSSRRNRMRQRLSARDLANNRHAGNSAMLLPVNVQNDVEQRRAAEASGLRRNHERIKTNVTAQLLEDKQAATREKSANQEFAEIKRTLDAKRLLARLSHTHGVNPDRYEVSQGQDGGDRIKAGTRNLNVSDFLTKELHLNYRVAGQILREAYREQTGQEPRLNPKQQARADLWNDYQGARKIKDQERKQETERGRETMQAKRQAIKQETGRKLAAIRSNRSLTPAERKAALSIARMEKVQAEEALREKAKAESDRRAAAKAEEYKNGYRNYLAERAQAGDEVALAELRRQRERKPEPTGPNVIERGDRDQEEETERALIMRKLAYSIDRAGNVTYYADQSKHKALIVDAGNRVTVTADKDARAVEAGLKLAIQKFGQHLTIEGNEAFKQQVIETVIKTGLHVSFDDKQMNDELQLRRAEREELRARGRAFIEAEKRRQLEVEPPINQPQPESHQQQQEKTEPEPEQTRSNEIER
jgi:hypothetical protein